MIASAAACELESATSGVYRPGFSGHKILLCGRPYWAECGEPFAPGLSRAAGGILLQQPVLVIARDEGPDRGANLLGIAEDPAPHDLLLEGADEPLRHTIGLRLADEGKARRQAEEGDLVLDVVGHKGAAVVVAEQKAAGGVGPHRPAGGVDGEIDSLGGGEAVGLFGDVPAEHLGVPVLDDHEEGDVAVLNGRDHRRVRAPHHAGRVGGDASVVVVDRPLRAAVRREQSILAHEAEPPVPADAEAIEGAQAGPGLAVPLAGEGRAIEVAADRLEQPRIVDHRPRPSPPARGRRLGDRPADVEGGARHAPGGANPPHAVGLIGRWGARGGHQRDLLRAKRPGRSMRARSNSTSLESSPIRRWASASSRSAGSSERSRNPVLSPARARACQRSNCQTGTPTCRETASTGSPRSRRNTTPCLRAKLQRWPGASGPAPAPCPVMDGMDELRSPSLPTTPATSIIVFPSPSTLSSSSFSGQYGVQRNRGQLSGCAPILRRATAASSRSARSSQAVRLRSSRAISRLG